MTVPRFWREIPQRYTLQGSRCKVCKTTHFPPRRICPHCRRQSLGKIDTVHLSGRGTVVEATRVHRPAAGYAMQTPYTVALIQTEEGPRLVGQVVDDGDVEAGDAVQAVFRKLGEDGESGVIHYGTKWARVQGPDGLEEE